ncbi:hypothetical protein LINGRAHAP2_LOCUS14712 [Linum grandiflorum]
MAKAAPGDVVLTIKEGVRFLETSAPFRAKLCEPFQRTLLLRLVDALTGGPWMILDHYLVVFAWDSQFRVTDDLPQRMVVWICFPRLPYQYYHCDVLEGLGNLVGKTIRPDKRTQHSVRGKFARIAVEIDLTVPAPKGVYVDGIWQVVEYENLPSFCSDCGRFGHSSASCVRHLGHTVSAPEILKPVAAQTPADITYSGDSPAEPEGPWQTVVKKRWRPKMAGASNPNGSVISVDLGKGKLNPLNPKGSFRGNPSINSSVFGGKFFGGGKLAIDQPTTTDMIKISRPATEAKIPKARSAQLPKAVSKSSISGLSSTQKLNVPMGGKVVRVGQGLSKDSIGLLTKPNATLTSRGEFKQCTTLTAPSFTTTPFENSSISNEPLPVIPLASVPTSAQSSLPDAPCTKYLLPNLLLLLSLRLLLFSIRLPHPPIRISWLLIPRRRFLLVFQGIRLSRRL